MEVPEGANLRDGGGPGSATRTTVKPGTVNLLAVVSFGFGLTGVGAPVAIIAGHVARRQIRRSGQRGDVLATFGIALGYLVFAGLLSVAVFYAASLVVGSVVG